MNMDNYRYFYRNLNKKNNPPSIMTNLKLNILSILHIRTASETVFTFIATIFWSIIAYHKDLFINNVNLFSAIWIVVWADWIFGVWRAKRNGNFETQKAFKVLYYCVAYTLMLQVVLAVEKGYPSASWMSEAIIMPVLTFQIISILKNMSLLRLIPQGLLLEILKKIDNYKEQGKDLLEDIKDNNNGTSTSTNN